MDVDGLELLIVLVVSVSFLIAVYFCIRLSQETRHERYWLALAIGAFMQALHHWLSLPWHFHLISESLLYWAYQLTALIGALFLAYAVYGLYSSMREIRRKI